MTLESVNDTPSRGLAPYFTEYVGRLLEKEDDALDINIYRWTKNIYYFRFKTSKNSRRYSARGYNLNLKGN